MHLVGFIIRICYPKPILVEHKIIYFVCKKKAYLTKRGLDTSFLLGGHGGSFYQRLQGVSHYTTLLF